MFTHPAISTAAAADRRRDLLARAGTRRLIRATARPRHRRGPAAASGLAQIIRRTRTAAAARTARTA